MSLFDDISRFKDLETAAELESEIQTLIERAKPMLPPSEAAKFDPTRYQAEKRPNEYKTFFQVFNLSSEDDCFRVEEYLNRPDVLVGGSSIEWVGGELRYLLVLHVKPGVYEQLRKPHLTDFHADSEVNIERAPTRATKARAAFHRFWSQLRLFLSLLL